MDWNEGTFETKTRVEETLEGQARTLWKPSLHQWMTPRWAAEAILERSFPSLQSGDFLIEPACGDAAFLVSIPPHVRAIGVDIDPEMARIAHEISGREVRCGDFVDLELPEGVTGLVGNPPFQAKLVERFLGRAHQLLPENGRAAFILPAYMLQTSTSVLRYREKFSIAQELLPRNLFPGIKLPIVLATFTKAADRQLFGFFLYDECAQIAGMSPEARQHLTAARSSGSVWASLVRRVMRELGGRASLSDLYGRLEGRRPTPTVHWREQVRKVLQQGADFRRVEAGVWELSSAAG